MIRKETIDLEFQGYIDYAPVAPKDLYAAASSSDTITINSWREIWMKNTKANHDKYKSFAENSIGQFYGHCHHKPAIVAGSGPSLKHNVGELKNRGSILLISCLHNFHFMEENEANVDFYVSLDAGEVVVDEVSEGGKKTEDEYWAMSKGKKLLCHIASSPKLLEKWQGEVYFYNCVIPDDALTKWIEDIEVFNSFVSTGGNVLGACLYIAKAIMGASIIGFVGADFSFSRENSFHPFATKYDNKLGTALTVKDVFGIPCKTWRSYFNFKGWFEFVTMVVPGVYFNCTEGGIFGAYESGNLRSVIQSTLKDFIRMISLYSEIEEQMKNPKTLEKKLLF